MRPNSATPAPVLVGGAQAKLRPCDCALQDKCIAGRLHPQLCFYEEQVSISRPYDVERGGSCVVIVVPQVAARSIKPHLA